MPSRERTTFHAYEPQVAPPSLVHSGTKQDGTHRAGAGVPPNFRRLLAGRGGLEVNASIVLGMHPLHLIRRFLEGVESALCPLNPDFFVLRNCVQGFDHRVHSLAVPCRHLCDTYLQMKEIKCRILH